MKRVKSKSVVRNIILVAVILGFIITQVVGSMRKAVAIVVAEDMTVTTDENDKLYISLSELNGARDGNQVGYAYAFENQQKLWNMAVHENAQSTVPIGIANNLYCAQAEYGYSWEEISPTTVATYPISYDFNNAIGQTESTVINELIGGEFFNEILWLVDNMYVPGESNKIKFLEQAGIFFENGQYSYIPNINGHDHSELITSRSTHSYTLDDGDIVAIQQAALWYFTNNDNEDFNRKGESNWLQFTLDGINYNPFVMWSNRNAGIAKNDFAAILFNYFIDEAEKVANELGEEKYELEKSKVKLWLSDEITDSETEEKFEEQPLLEIHKLKEFDLSLRKAIKAVKTEEGTTEKLTNIFAEDATRLLNTDGSIANITVGTLEYPDTTATYKHRKDPVVVKKGQIVEYVISIYNEGKADGYVTKIVDQLPPISELRLLSNNDIISTHGNVYSVKFDVNNKVELILKDSPAYLIPGYDGETLSYDTITLQCEVMATPEEENGKILTNIAYISEAVNSETGEIITTQIGKDRDSVPAQFPTYQGVENDNNQDGVTYWNLENADYGYIGRDSNQTDLPNNDVYYEGIEDDDDFEKIIVMPIKDITVTKKWEDSNNQDGIRDEYEVTLTGTVNGEVVYTNSKMLPADDLDYTWPGLAVYSKGEEIIYTVSETQIPEGYEVSGEETLTIVNTHKPAETEVTVRKVWEDVNNQDGKRPESIEVQLYSDGETLREKVTLNSENKWTYKWTELAKYKNENGIVREIVYEVKELTKEGTAVQDGEYYDENYEATYTTTINTTTITNTYIPEETTAKVIKVWEDENNQDGKRPESIEVQLYADGIALGEKVTLNNENKWTYEWTELAKYKNEGTLIVYEIKELTKEGTAVENEGNYDENYKATYTTAINTTTITNTYEPEKTEVEVTKVWEDENNQDGIRPESIQVQLYADGVALGEKVTLNSENKWTYEWTELAKYKNGGTLIVYEVKELTKEGTAVENKGNYDENYKATYTTAINTTTITNTYIPEETTAKVIKVWEDENNQDGKRPESIEVQLYADGVALGEKVTLNSENKWTHEWTELAKYKNGGTLIVYEVKELTKEGTAVENKGNYDENYKATYTTAINTTTITNTYIPEETTAKVIKVWEDENNQDGKRPESIEVQLYADGVALGEKVTLNSENKWTHEWTELAKYKNGGTLIVYEVKELTKEGTAVENEENYDENYKATYTTAINTTTITNTYEPEKTEVEVTKVWEDENNQDGIRPESIQVQLYADGEALGENYKVTLNEQNQWKKTWTMLPKYINENGTVRKIVYEVKELTEAGIAVENGENYNEKYQATYQSEGNTIKIINVYEPEKTSVTVTKIWNDANNQDGKRPESIQVQLYADGESLGENYRVTLNEEKQWKHTWTNLEKNRDEGTPIVYTVDEVEVPTGYGKSIEGYTITNTYIPVTTEITVNKVWEDENNQDGIRQESITVILKANGEEVDRKTITEEDNWTHTFTDLAEYENGEPITYTIEEIVPEGYEVTQNEKVENGVRIITLTNTHTPETVSKTVLKIWQDNNNQDGIRPNSIEIQLYANGESLGENYKITLTAGEDGIWQDEELRDTWTNLPKNKDGKEIVYTVKEVNVANGYTATYSKETENAKVAKIPQVTPEITVAKRKNIGTVTNSKAARIQLASSVMEVAETAETNEILTVTNTHTPEVTQVVVEKLWNDSNNQYKVRPTKIKVQLYANGEVLGTPIELNSSNGWKKTWVDLPKKENGQDIQYTVKELNSSEEIVENGQKYNESYITTYEQNNNDIKITNTLITFDLKLIKYISSVNSVEVPTRLENVDLSMLNKYDENSKKWISTGNYILEKDPVKLEQNDYVTYTFRIYNESNYDGYATEISENIPEGLEFLVVTDGVIFAWDGTEQRDITEEVQKSGMYKEIIETNSIWGYTQDSTIITTRGLSEELIKGYGQENTEYADSENQIDYKEISVIFKVKEGTPANTVIRNEAAISEDKAIDENGTEVSVEDRDSTPGNTEEDWKKENSEENYDEEGKWPIYVEDDEDYDNIIIKVFDLSLRKRIAQIKDVDTNKVRMYSRSAKLDTDNSQINTLYDYYNKYALIPGVKAGDIVTYSLVIYNEGEIDGYASLIVDALPEGLELVSYKPGDGSTNDKYGWTLVEGTENVYQTNYLSYEKDANKGTLESTILKAYDGEGEASYQEIYIECKVKESITPEDDLLNVSQIAEDSDSDGDEIVDTDSVPGTSDDEEKWKNEDDLDIEILELKEFDLALRKFITKVENGENTKEVTTRVPQVSYNKETKELEYTHTKDALIVHVGDTVIYTLRVYNEGDIDGYASEIKDDIPEYLEYLPEHETNIEHQWKMYDKDGNKTENVEEAVFIKTNHLAMRAGLEEEDSERSNLIKAFDKESDINEKNPDYKEIEVAFKVKDPNSTEYEIINFAQISDDTDSEGDPIKDRDSETDNGEEEPKEDDEDIEKVKVEYFDLSLLKYVTKVLVNENGVERVIETGNIGDEDDIIPHVQMKKKNIDKTVVKFAYTIKITNEGQIPGEATEITDYVPEGLKFVAEDNELWTDEGNNVISTKQLEGSVLEPGESVEAEVVLRWVNNSENLGAKTNVAEISEDYNEENVPDKDSTPDNKKEGEDDIDDATVLLSVNQGGILSSEYTKILMLFLSIILVGGILIKKFVL